MNRRENRTEANQLIINTIQKKKRTDFDDDFDSLIFDTFFYDLMNFEISRLRTDAYGDGGVDYLFFTLNDRVILSLDDEDDIKENDIIDIHFVQIKESPSLDSDVPNKLIEISNNFFTNSKPQHYNQEIISNIELFEEISELILPKGKFNVHYYYFGLFDKTQLETATDLKGRFETLKERVSDYDFVNKVNFNILNVNDIYNAISKGREYEYDFTRIEKYTAEVNEETMETEALIALIPLKQYYDFIKEEDDSINTKLFESNIRDFKGSSNVNKEIMETLSNTDQEKIQFWWLNNGITIIAEQIHESNSAKKINIKNPQIVNGLQTSYSIYNFFNNNPEKLNEENRDIFIKIIKINPELEGKELDITIATNRQNEIRDKDIRANDEVQKNIELYFREHGKYYQRKDKYYTNRKMPKKDIVTLFDLAKYLHTIYFKDPAFTRNNPGKLLKDDKYNEIFKLDDERQDYDRYLSAYKIYEHVVSLNKGEVEINGDQFDKVNFIHHLVYVSISLALQKRHYSIQEVKELDLNNINEDLIDDSYSIIIDSITSNEVPQSKILKTIKERVFNNYLNEKLDEKLNRDE